MIFMAEKGKGPEVVMPPQGDYNQAELQYIFQIYQERYSVLSEEIKELLQLLQQLGGAVSALENPNDIKNKEALLNVGGDLYIPTKITALNKVVMNIGAGLAIEKDVAGASETLKKRIEKQNDALNKMIDERRQVEQLLNDISYRLGDLVG